MSNLKLLLTLAPNAKGVPYEAMAHADGTHTHRFIALKGRPQCIGAVEEAKGVACYQALLETLNAPASPFFSVGCEKGGAADASGHWRSGFMEFAFNSTELVADAGNYFSLFYHFSSAAEAFIDTHGVQFHWILQPARFAAGPCDGFTCSVWFTTAQFPSAAEAQQEWTAAVDRFSEFMGSVESQPGVPLYDAAA